MYHDLHYESMLLYCSLILISKTSTGSLLSISTLSLLRAISPDFLASAKNLFVFAKPAQSVDVIVGTLLLE